MSITPRFTLDDRVVEGIRDWKNASVRVSFNNLEKPRVSFEKIVFQREAFDYLRQWEEGGVTGESPGVTEAPSFRWDITNRKNVTTNILDGYVNLMNEAIYFCDEIQANVEQKNDIDLLTERADAYSFAFLESIGKIKSSDYQDVFYKINSIPNFTEAAIAAISIFILTKELLESIERLAEVVKEAINSGIDSVSAALKVIAKVLINVAYFASIVIALIGMIKKLIENLFRRVKSHKAMKVSTLLEKASEHLGYKFSSTVYQTGHFKDLYCMPRKRAIIENGKTVSTNSKKGFPDLGSPIYTFGDAFREFKKLINGRITIKDDTIFLERRDFFKSKGSYQFPDVDLNRYGRQNNTFDLKSNALWSFTTDSEDVNTLNDYKGTVFQVITDQITVKREANVLIKGFNETAFPFSLASRKEDFSLIESTMIGLASLADSVVKALGGNSNFSKGLKINKGIMNLSSDFTSAPKLIILNSSGFIPSNHRDILSGEAIYDNFYNINSFVGANNNQKHVYNGVVIPFNQEDLISLLDVNFSTLPDGREIEIENIEWEFDNDEAIVDLTVDQVWTNNLKETRINPE